MNSRRKIEFYAVKITDEKGKLHNDILFKMVNYICTFPEDNRTIPYSKYNKDKMCLLETSPIAINNDYREIIMISGITNHRPDIREFNSIPIGQKAAKSKAGVRPNPKNRKEGEEEKSHIIITQHDGEMLVLFESRKIFSFGAFLSYVRYFIRLYCAQNNIKHRYEVEHSIIPVGDFLTKLNELHRVKLGNIYIDKKILGSEELNYSDRTTKLKDTLMLQATAKRGENIIDTIIDIVKRFKLKDSEIKKIRVEGFVTEGTPIVLDTDYCQRKEYINVKIDPSTQTVADSKEVFAEMEGLLIAFIGEEDA